MTDISPAARFSDAIAHLDQGAIAVARFQLDALVQELPHEAQVLFVHSVACLRGGDIRSCIESAHRALNADPLHQASKKLLADLAAQGIPALPFSSPEGDRSVKFVERATEHLAAGRTTLALITIEKAVSLRTFKSGQYYLYAVCLRALGREREAFEVLQKEVIFFPQNTPAIHMYEELARILRDQPPCTAPGLNKISTGAYERRSREVRA